MKDTNTAESQFMKITPQRAVKAFRSRCVRCRQIAAAGITPTRKVAKDMPKATWKPRETRTADDAE